MSPNRCDSWNTDTFAESSSDEWNHIYNNFNAQDVLIIKKLYWPVFKEINGMFIREEVVSEFKDRIESSPSSSVTERSYNLIKLWDLFHETVDESIYIQLAESMKIIWTASLKTQFDNKEFIVELINSDQSYGPMLTAYRREV